MTNRELFLKIFDRYASEIWALPEEEFLKWTEQEAPDAELVVRCEDCVYSRCPSLYCRYEGFYKNETDFCNRGKRRDDS